jgi:hypothetical protein
MNAERTSWLNSKTITVLVLGLVIGYFMVNAIVSERLQDLELQSQVLVADQEAVLVAIAETTARNGADAVTESVIQDCSIDERSRFDTLLGELNAGLTQAELVELERLFGRCGAFYAERKAVMVARFTREIEVYEDYVEQLELITATELESANVDGWQKLAEEERKQSELFSELVNKQEEIIQALLDGASADSENVQSILREVTEIQETLIVANQQAANLRSTLVNL